MTKVLVVEDFDQFRQFIVSTLQKRAEFQVKEASNGLEALQKAEEQQPDLVLLDIGLPDLNGIEVARRLRRLAIPPKIVFVSQESSPEIVREALDLGALGYVHKRRAGSDLLPAIEAALEGKRFVSVDPTARSHPSLGEINAKLTRLTNLSELLNVILDAAIEITAADFGTVQIYDQKSAELKLMAHRSFGPAFVKFFATIKDDNCCCCGTALRSGKRMVVEDVATDPIFDDEARAIIMNAGARAVQSTPIYSRDGILCGMLATHYRRPQRPNGSILKLMDALALQAGDCIQQIRLLA